MAGRHANDGLQAGRAIHRARSSAPRPATGALANTLAGSTDVGSRRPRAGVIAWITSPVAARTAVYVVAAVMPFAVSGIDRPLAGIALCAALAALQPVVGRASRGLPVHLVNAVVDTAAVIALAAIAPSLWYTSLLVIVAGSTILSAAMRAEAHLLLIGLLVVTLLIIAAENGPLGWFPSMLVGAGAMLVARRHGRDFQRRLQANDDLLEQAMHASGSIAQTVDLMTGRVIEVIGDVIRVTGWAADTWRSMPLTSLALGDDAQNLAVSLARLEEGDDIDMVVRYLDPSNDCRWLRFSGRAEVDDRARPVLRGMVTDVSEMHRISAALHDQVRIDRTTSLPNRHRLEEDLDDLAVHQIQFGYLIVDIHEFKAINNTIGHHIGDLILTMMATRLAQHAPSGRVYHLGADQFAMILEGVTDPSEAEETAERVAAECRRPYPVGRVAFGAPVHIGVAMSSPTTAPSHTIRQADVALDRAKARRREVVSFHDDMQRTTLDNLTLSAAVEQGLDRGEFALHFQPKVDLTSGLIVGAEGLVRWIHPERGLLMPAAFLDALRLSATFERFTEVMVRQALQAADASRGLPRPMHYSVNIEVRSLCTPGFADRLITAYGQHQLGRNVVVLEVTETDLGYECDSDGGVDPIEELQRLREAGFEVSIDDFGTGASSLARLSRLPADEVKIDREFVKALFTDDRADVLVEAIVQLGRNLGLRVVAEGIENFDQSGFLVESGCDQGQGYLFKHAIALSELLASFHRPFDVTEPSGSVHTDTAVTPISAARSAKAAVAS